MTIHYHFRKNKRVMVILQTGEHLILRFWMQDGKAFKFTDHDPIPIEAIRSITIYREPPERIKKKSKA